MRLQDGIALQATRPADRRNATPRSVIIGHPVKPVFEGAFDLAEPRGAVAGARTAARGGADHDWLRQIIGEIKTRAAASNRLSA